MGLNGATMSDKNAVSIDWLRDCSTLQSHSSYCVKDLGNLFSVLPLFPDLLPIQF